jgi:hypothetical protein
MMIYLVAVMASSVVDAVGMHTCEGNQARESAMYSVAVDQTQMQ